MYKKSLKFILCGLCLCSCFVLFGNTSNSSKKENAFCLTCHMKAQKQKKQSYSCTCPKKPGKVAGKTIPPPLLKRLQVAAYTCNSKIAKAFIFCAYGIVFIYYNYPIIGIICLVVGGGFAYAALKK